MVNIAPWMSCKLFTVAQTPNARMEVNEFVYDPRPFQFEPDEFDQGYVHVHRGRGRA